MYVDYISRPAHVLVIDKTFLLFIPQSRGLRCKSFGSAPLSPQSCTHRAVVGHRRRVHELHDVVLLGVRS